jgi:hypothetical protein
MTINYHLAQINVARMLALLDDPLMADFVAQLDRVNAIAEQSPGFVWRLQGETGNATDIRAFEDERILVNMSVWESIEALHQFVYRSEHIEVYRPRKKWFEPITPPYVLWWIPAGHLPTVEEGKARLELLARGGSSSTAFSFKQRFQPPGSLA